MNDAFYCFFMAIISIGAHGFFFYKTLPNVKKDEKWQKICKNNKQPLILKILFIYGCVCFIGCIIIGILIITRKL